MQIPLPTETVSVGSIISLPLVVTTDVSVNAVSATLRFPFFLEPLSVETTESPVSLWVVAPRIDAKTNTLRIEGLILDKGFIGRATILNVQVRVISAGDGYVSIERGTVLANDGLGTNILTDLKNSQHFIATIISNNSEPLPFAQADVDKKIVAPTITRYSSQIKNINNFFVEGTTYPDAKVYVAFQSGGVTEQFRVWSDSVGFFRFVYPTSEDTLEETTLSNWKKAFTASTFVLQDRKKEFFVWAEKDDFITPETKTVAVVVKGVPWEIFSLGLTPTIFSILIGILTGLVTVLFFLFRRFLKR